MLNLIFSPENEKTPDKIRVFQRGCNFVTPRWLYLTE